jgi:hypothetical protein
MTGDKFVISRKEAITRLTNRYARECDLYPLTRRIPLETYIKRNIRMVRVYGSLESFSHA